jgi:hypothetical protein
MYARASLSLRMSVIQNAMRSEINRSLAGAHGSAVDRAIDRSDRLAAAGEHRIGRDEFIQAHLGVAGVKPIRSARCCRAW